MMKGPPDVHIRPGELGDAEAVVALDETAQHDTGRADYIRGSMEAGECLVAIEDGAMVGYAVVTHNFFNQGMVQMLYVARGHRRRGIAQALLHHAEGVCDTPKLFTSTNLSNSAMQMLLAKNGYTMTGFIDNLDEGDPEIIYYKRLVDGPR